MRHLILGFAAVCLILCGSVQPGFSETAGKEKVKKGWFKRSEAPEKKAKKTQPKKILTAQSAQLREKSENTVVVTAGPGRQE